MREYYVTFSALRMSRHEIMEHVCSVFGKHRISPDDEADCEEIAFDAKLGRYQWTGRTSSCGGISDALARTQSWRGLVLYFRYVVEDVLGELSVILWNDAEPGVTTLVICENSTLFNIQREQERHWMSFQQILLDMMTALQASFCYLQCDPPLRTLGDEMIFDALARIRAGRLVPSLLAIQVERFSESAALPASVMARCRVRRERGYLIISDCLMGTPNSDD